MCGINGIIKFGKKVSSKDIDLMNNKITHRGPDDKGKFIENSKNFSIGLGQTRLAIIDLSDKGHQPMGIDSNGKLIFEDKKLKNSQFVLVFNGEIYNFKKLRKTLESEGVKFQSNSDSEVLLRSYIKWNIKCPEHLEGMFAFVIFDKKNKMIFGARDRFGKKPLKYFWNNEQFIFSSELKSILENKIKRKVDYQAIYHYLTLQYVPEPHTGFEGINKLPHSSFFVFDIEKKSLKVEKYQTAKKINRKINNKKTIKLVEKSIIKSIKKRMIADVEIGTFLSGGIDSSLITAVAAKIKKSKLKTFTIKFNEIQFDESKYAKLVAKKYMTDHKEILVKPDDMIKYIDEIVEQYEEPFADSSQLPTYILAKETSKDVKVVLSGDGGDENYGGYEKYTYHIISKLLSKIIPKFIVNHTSRLNIKKFSKIKTFLETLHLPYYKKHLHYTNYFDPIEKDKIITEFFSKKIDINTKYQPFEKHKKHSKNVNAVMDLDFETYIPDDIMVKVDMATMKFGLEARSPLLDQEIKHLSNKIKSNKKVQFFNKKIILKQISKKYLPKKLLNRKKKGFSIPLDIWFRSKLKSIMIENLLDKNSLISQLIKENKIKKIISEHLKGTNHGKKIWLLLMLNLWHKKYFKNG